MWGREGWKGNIKRSSGKITYWIYAHSSKSEVVCKGYAWVLILSCFRKTGEKSWKIGLLPCSNSLFEHWICSGFSVGLKGVILWNTATLQLFWRRDLFAGAVTRSQVPRVQSNKARAGRRESSPSFLSESPAQMFQDEKVEESSRSGLPSLYPHLCRRHFLVLLFVQNRRWLRVGLWLQCGDTDCLPGQEEVNLSGNLGREQVPKSRLPGHMAAQVRLFCRTKSKVVWETRIFRDYMLWQQESNHV